MLTFDIPIYIKVSAVTEEQAEDLVAKMITEGMRNGPALTNPFITWDFIEFVEEEEGAMLNGAER